jgi:hypothetical protein
MGRVTNILRSIRPRSGSESQKTEAGLSLVELLVTMIVLIVVLLAIYATWSRLESTYAFTADDMLAQEQARAAMGEMVEYIRTAREPASVVGVFPVPENLRRVIVYASPTEIQMWVDTNRDEKHTLELVRYQVADGSLSRATDPPPYSDAPSFTGSTRMVRAHVANDPSTPPLFTYREANDSPPLNSLPSVKDTNLIREITIDLLVDIYVDRAPVAHELTSIVQPRNLR